MASDPFAAAFCTGPPTTPAGVDEDPFAQLTAQLCSSSKLGTVNAGAGTIINNSAGSVSGAIKGAGAVQNAGGGHWEWGGVTLLGGGRGAGGKVLASMRDMSIRLYLTFSKWGLLSLEQV